MENLNLNYHKTPIFICSSISAQVNGAVRIMNNIEPFDTDLNDEDLFHAVEAVLSNQAQPAATTSDKPVSPVQQNKESTSYANRLVNHQSLDELLKEQQNENTKRKTTNDLKLFQSWKNESRYLQCISPCELDDYISGFLLSVRKRDGIEFEPSTVRSFVSSINCHLIMSGYKFSIMTEAQFRDAVRFWQPNKSSLSLLGKVTNQWQQTRLQMRNLRLCMPKRFLV